MCSDQLQYAATSGICQKELSKILTSSNCPPNLESNIFVMRNEEARAAQLINGLDYIGASVECKMKAVPFLCLYLLGLCGESDESAVYIQPTTSQCEEIRDTICQQQWKIIEGFNFGLPDCASFPPKASSCPAQNDSQSTIEASTKNMLGTCF